MLGAEKWLGLTPVLTVLVVLAIACLTIWLFRSLR